MRDGFLIVNTTLALFRDYKPLTFFGSAGLILGRLLGSRAAVVFEFIKTGLARLPLALLAVALVLCGVISITVGLILHSIARRSQESEYQIQVLADEMHGWQTKDSLIRIALKSRDNYAHSTFHDLRLTLATPRGVG